MKKLVYEFCYRLFGYSVFQKLYQPKVKEHLRILHPTMEKQEALRTYYARKTADLLPVLLVGICFLLLLYGKEKTESVLQTVSGGSERGCTCHIQWQGRKKTGLCAAKQTIYQTGTYRKTGAVDKSF